MLMEPSLRFPLGSAIPGMELGLSPPTTLGTSGPGDTGRGQGTRSCALSEVVPAPHPFSSPSWDAQWARNTGWPPTGGSSADEAYKESRPTSTARSPEASQAARGPGRLLSGGCQKLMRSVSTCPWVCFSRGFKRATSEPPLWAQDPAPAFVLVNE